VEWKLLELRLKLIAVVLAVCPALVEASLILSVAVGMKLLCVSPF
jgi:hypothetical protein